MDTHLEEQFSEPVRREWHKLQLLLEQSSERHCQEQRVLVASFFNDMLRLERRAKRNRSPRSDTVESRDSDAVAGSGVAALSSRKSLATPPETGQQPSFSPRGGTGTPAGGGGRGAGAGAGAGAGGGAGALVLLNRKSEPTTDALRNTWKQTVRHELLMKAEDGAEFTRTEQQMEKEWLAGLAHCGGAAALQDAPFSSTKSTEHFQEVKTLAMSDLELMLRPLHNLHTWIANLKEPLRTSNLAGVVDSRAFDLFCWCVIILNSVVTWIIASDTLSSVLAGMETRPWTRSVGRNRVEAINLAFVFWYWVELCLRIFVHRLHFFCNVDWGWNVLDFVIVLVSTLETVLTLSSQARLGNTVGFGRLSRALKIVRVLRVMKVLRIFMIPRLMLDCLLTSLSEIFWASVILAFTLYIFALVIVQTATTHLLDMEETDSNHAFKEQFFGDGPSGFRSVSHAILSLLQAVSGGDHWAQQYEMAAELGWPIQVLYTLFQILFNVVIWNVFTAIIIQRISYLAAPDLEEELMARQKRELDTAESLMIAFSHMDQDHSGSISLEEFTKALADEDFRDAFKVTGLDIEDVAFLFDVLTMHTGEDTLDIRDVIAGIMKMRGMSTSIDQFTSMQMIKKVRDDQHNFILFCMRRLQGLTERLHVAEELTQRSPEAAHAVAKDIFLLGTANINPLSLLAPVAATDTSKTSKTDQDSTMTAEGHITF